MGKVSMTLSLACCRLERGRSPERGRRGRLERGRGKGRGKRRRRATPSHPRPRMSGNGESARGVSGNSRDTRGHAGEPGCTPGLELRGRDLLDFHGGRHVRQRPDPWGCPAGRGGRVGAGGSTQQGGGQRGRGGWHSPSTQRDHEPQDQQCGQQDQRRQQPVGPLRVVPDIALCGRGRAGHISRSRGAGGTQPSGPRRGSGHSGASRRGQWRPPKDGGPHGRPNTSWSPCGGPRRRAFPCSRPVGGGTGHAALQRLPPALGTAGPCGECAFAGAATTKSHRPGG